jgi:uncharacterized SAM-binding protein YcdF (DUF218 family)
MHRETAGSPTPDEAKLLFLEDPPEKADLAIVFGHSDPQVRASRARHAARLFKDGFVPRLLLTGGGQRAPGEPSEAHQMAEVALQLGVPEDALLLETRSRNTFENAHYSREVLREKGFLEGLSAVLLVSCPWHMRRVVLVTRREFPPPVRLLSSPHADSCTRETWELLPECRQTVRFEYQLLRRFIEQGLLSA